MPTTYTDQFYIIDPYNPPPFGTALNFTRFDLVDQNDDGDIDRFDNDMVDGQDVTSSWPGDTVSVNVPGIGVITYTGITFYLADGRQVFTPTDGKVLYDGTLDSANGVTVQGPLNIPTDLGPTCFTPGTLIKTVSGLRPIEELKVGDLVHTRDHGLQPLRWISREKHAAFGPFAPVLIARGALDNRADIWVSQQHRILVTGWQAQMYLGQDEVLIAAKSLVNGCDIRIVEGGEVEYIHLLFDQHEILNTSGMRSESYHPAHAAAHPDRAVQAEMAMLFPNAPAMGAASFPAARQVARSFEACLFAA